MRPLALALRASWGALAAPAAMLAAVAYGLLNNGWVGAWMETAQTAVNAFTLALPLIVLAAGLDAQRDSDVSSPLYPGRGARSGVVITLWRWVGITSWMLAAFIAASATLLITTWGRSDPIEFPWLVLTVGVGWIAAHTALGLALGAYLPRLGLLIVAAVAPFLLNVGLAYGTGSPSALLTALDNGVLAVGTRLAPEAAARQLAWFCALTVGGLIVATARRSKPWLGMAAAGVMVGVGLVSVLTGPGERGAPVAEEKQICAEGVVVVCVWKEHAYYLPALRDVTDAMVEDLDTVLPLPDRVAEAGLALSDSSVSFYIGTQNAGPGMLAEYLAPDLVGWLACGGTPGEVAVSDDVLVRERWLAWRAVPDALPPQAFDETHGIPEGPISEQVDWFAAGLDGACAPL